MWSRAWRLATSVPVRRGGPCALAAVALPGVFRPPSLQHSFVQCMVGEDGASGAASSTVDHKDAVKCLQCESTSCFCPRQVKGFLKLDNAYFTDNFGKRIFWPRVVKNDDGKLYMRCFLCANFSSGVSFASQGKMHKDGLDIVKSKVCKTTLNDHIKHGKDGDHGRCEANYLAAHPKADAASGQACGEVVILQSRAAKRAMQKPTKELLNHFAWLHLALSLPVSENKFGKIMHVADQTCAEILEGQYLGKYFFNDGLDCFNRVVSEGIFRALKKARQVAWHLDVGGGRSGDSWFLFVFVS